jgi:rod shape-determining protein MreC
LGLIILGFGLAFIQTASRNAGRASVVDLIIRTVCSPLSSLFSNGVTKFSGALNGAFAGDALREKTRSLQRQVNLQGLYDERINDLRREVDALRRLNRLAPTYGRPFVMADIMGYFPLENRITLAAGRDKGITPKMPVVCGDGLVGIVQTVGPKECQALLVTSSAVQVGAIGISHNPPPSGLTKGENSTTLVVSLPGETTSLVNKDLMTTSGFSEMIPRGIPIGRVLTVEPLPDIGSTRVRILPFVDVGSLREVVIFK